MFRHTKTYNLDATEAEILCSTALGNSSIFNFVLHKTESLDVAMLLNFIVKSSSRFTLRNIFLKVSRNTILTFSTVYRSHNGRNRLEGISAC